MRGEIVSTEKVIILSTGLVLGNISTPRLIVEEGVIFNGSCRITTPPADSPRGGPSNGQRPAASLSPKEAVHGQRR